MRRFDAFIMGRMGYPWNFKQPDKQVRRQAFLTFRQKTGHMDFVSLPTMHRWFGINGYHKPSRYNIFQMAFAMGLNREETRAYLTEGIGEPSFYVNDYQEMIYLYGIDHGCTMAHCEKMISFFEGNLEDNVVISHTRSTKELMNAYESVTDLSTEEFLWWMGGRADWFKGYSQTALNYVIRYRDSILSWVREEEKNRLWELLGEVFGKSEHYAKRYSDLLRGPILKEQLIHAAQAKRQLERCRREDEVPDWIRKFIEENIHTSDESLNVTSALSYLSSFCAEKRQRCPLIQREDLLPLIYTVCL